MKLTIQDVQYTIDGQWDYEQSVEKMRPMVVKWKNTSAEMLEELWIAREALSTRANKTSFGRDGTFVPSWNQYCEDIGLEKRTANRWLKRFDPETKQLLDEPGAHVGENTGYYEWYTPPEITESAKECMGSIDLDPATTDIANKVVGASKIYTEEDNGLDQEWAGNVWMNPPYKEPLITQFSEKLTSEYRSGNVRQACVIVNNATETQWFQKLVKEAAYICFPKTRVKFYDAFNERETNPLQGQAILYFGDNWDNFVSVFSKLGFIVEVIKIEG